MGFALAFAGPLGEAGEGVLGDRDRDRGVCVPLAFIGPGGAKRGIRPGYGIFPLQAASNFLTDKKLMHVQPPNATRASPAAH